MESVISYFAGIGIDFWTCLKFAGILLLGALLLSSVTRFIFRKPTMLGSAVSSSIAIVFIYVMMVFIITVISKLRFLIAPLPFASISEDTIRFFSFTGSGYAQIASEILSMIILAFLVSIVDGWMPKSKNLFKWLLWRCVTVAIGLIMHFVSYWLINRYLPQVIVLYAPSILLAILVIMLLTGALKLLVGLVLTTVSPIIAALYTFFFATVVGKQLTKAVLTTAILAGVVFLLEDMGIAALSLASEALIAYVPFLILLVLVWYLVCLL